MSSRSRTADALLDGRRVDDERELRSHRDVERFLGELRSTASAHAAPAPNAALTAILDGRAPIGRTHEVGDASGARARVRPFVPARRWLRAGTCVPSAVFAVLFGGLAAAGALPAPVQHATAHFASHFGVTLPGASRSRHVPSTAPATAVTHATPAGAPDSRSDHHERAPATKQSQVHTGAGARASTGATANSSGANRRGPVPPLRVAPLPTPHLTVPTLPAPTVTAPPVTVPAFP